MTGYLDSAVVSSEYVFWQQEEMEVRAFLVATNRGMDPWFDAEWTKAEDHANAIFDPEVHDVDLVPTTFERAVGIYPSDYFWQLSSAVVKDACSLYEVFLEQMANAVLNRSGARLATLATEDSWHWPQCELFFRHYIGVEVKPPKIEAILWMRNKLTHLRNELRTDSGRKEFASHLASLGIDGPVTKDEAALGLVDHQPYLGKGVQLSQLQTLRILDVLRDQIGQVAMAAFPYDYRGATSKCLEAVKNKTPIKIRDFPHDKIIDF